MSIPTTIERHPEFHRDSLTEVVRQQVVHLQTHAANRLTSVPALAIGSVDAADIRVDAAVDYIRDGIQQSQISAAEVAVPANAAMADDGVARKVRVLVYVDDQDALAAVCGDPILDSATLVTPQLPAGGVQIGYVDITSDGSAVFTPGTTLLSAATVTDTYVNAPVPAQNWAVPARLGNT